MEHVNQCHRWIENTSVSHNDLQYHFIHIDLI